MDYYSEKQIVGIFQQKNSPLRPQRVERRYFFFGRRLPSATHQRLGNHKILLPIDIHRADFVHHVQFRTTTQTVALLDVDLARSKEHRVIDLVQGRKVLSTRPRQFGRIVDQSPLGVQQKILQLRNADQRVETLVERRKVVLNRSVIACGIGQRPITLEQLAREFPEEVMAVLRLLTHEKGVSDTEYLTAIKSNPIALKVKLADNAHNSNQSRCCCGTIPPEKLAQWQSKYARAKEILLSR